MRLSASLNNDVCRPNARHDGVKRHKVVLRCWLLSGKDAVLAGALRDKHICGGHKERQASAILLTAASD